MFNKISSDTPTPPRQAEHTDTRQAIVRHEPDYEQQKKKKKKNNESLFNEITDNPVVTIEALEMFLEDCVKSHIRTKPSQNKNIIPDTPNFIPPKKPTTTNGYAAHAASAYAARSGDKPSTHTPSEESHEEEAKLSAEEIRAIFTLIEDIKSLKEANIMYLQIELKDSFLQSVEAAIIKAKGNLN